MTSRAGEENTASPCDVYAGAILSEAPRVLGLMDRDDMSPTFGCLDRTFWAWKFSDFPGARFQEGLTVLSFLWAHPLPGTKLYHQNEKLLRWIAGGIDFWSRIQRSSGDFDEAYPLERSLAATACTSFCLAEASNFLGEHVPVETGRRLRVALRRAGDWLARNDERHGLLSNHLAAAAAALYHIYRLTGEERFEVRSRYFLDKILSHQSPEGWYEEYGGADPGYQTYGSFYLARYLQLSQDQALRRSLESSVKFLAHFIHPDLSIGGEYASRNTQTYYPAALEMLAAQNGYASWIAQTMLPTLRDLRAVGLGSIDSYNYFPLLVNYVFAYLAAQKNASSRAEPTAPPEEEDWLHFERAGILKVRKRKYDVFVGLMKGGVVKLFDREKRCLVFSNCGYVGRLTNGKPFSNQWSERSRKIELSEAQVVITGSFYQVSRPVMSPATFVAFRLFNLTLGRLASAAYWLKSLLVDTLIYRKQVLDLQFTRRLRLADDSVEIEDFLQGSLGEKIASLRPGESFTTIHMGSSRYFVPHELRSSGASDAEFWSAVEPKDLRDGVRRTARIVL